MAILNNNPLIGSGGNQGYNINNSLRFRSSASAYLNRTFGTGSGTISTFSAWVKRGTLGSVAPIMFVSPNGTEDAGLQFDGSNNLSFSSWNGAGGRPLGQLITTQVFRDPSAWYHIVLAIDTTQATSSNRLKLYVNGNQVTAFGTATYPSQNATHYWNLAYEHRLGRYAAAAGTNYIDGYMAEVNFIDGSAKTPSDFGETDTTTGVWKPKAYTGTYGTNGFYLKFSDIATTSGSNAGLGKDFSGNSNYWTTNNISVTSGTTYDAMTDSPTNTSATVANYAVLNPLQSSATLSSANLQAASSTSGWKPTIASMAMTSGKWYAEFTVGFADVNNGIHVGIVGENFPFASGNYIGQSSTSYGYRSYNGNKYNNGSNSAYGASFTTGDVIGIALDLDAGTITFYKNNTSQGTAYTGLAGVYFFAVSFEYTTSSPSGNFNFGQRPFSYTPPTGFVALNTYNLPTPTILQGNKYMDATLWTGDNANPKAITNAAGFKPDLVWVKSRSNAQQHVLNDSVRGAGTSKGLSSNTTDAEGSANILLYGAVTAFNSNGFSVGDGTSNQAFVNYSPYTYVGWQWQAGQGSTSSNTSGSITSTVSVNTTAGFSVVTYTGTGSLATVGHGLGVAPSMVIVKARGTPAGTARNWFVYHTSAGNTKYLELNTTSDAGTNSGFWNNTSPTSTVFTINTNAGVNYSAETYVAYCWADVSGYSKAFSYTGNGSSDGPMVYLGFRPKFVIIKRTDAAGESWRMIDTSRSPYNAVRELLLPDTSGAESSVADWLDIVSNGFKLRVVSSGQNASGGTYIGIAFAENPFKVSLAR